MHRPSARSEAISPYVDVGTLNVSAPGTDAESLSAQVERSVFDPWQALAEHRPLGEVMRARKVVYFVSQKERGAA